MPRKKFLSKEQILEGMKQAHSIKALGRYLNCSRDHLQNYLKLYVDEETGKTLHEILSNRGGKGIPKNISRKIVPLEDILLGKAEFNYFEPSTVKNRLIEEGYLKEECCKCGYHERRVVDFKIPLILNFKDKNKVNYKLENLELVCYNCYFLFINDLFSKKQLLGIESTVNNFYKEEDVKWEMDDYTQKRLNELGLDSKKDDPYNLVAKL